MSSLDPRAVVTRFLEAGWAPGGWDMEVIDECFGDDYYSHTWKGDLAHTGARQGRFFSALRLVERHSHDVVAENDFVVHRVTATYEHVGELFGIAATGKTVTCQHVEMWRVRDGKIVEHWGGLGEGGQLYRALSS